jgi:hypothetical protein
VKKVALDKGKKRARTLSSVSEQGSPEPELEIISVSEVKPVTHHTKRMKKINVHALAESVTHSATQDPMIVHALAESMSRSAIRDAESPPIPVQHLPKSTSPTAERISKALRKQRLPTSKEMSSFRTSPAFCPTCTLTK